MAHIHLEDGAFSLMWIVVWTIVAIALVLVCIYWLGRAKKADSRAYVTAAMLTAASFAIFQINIPLFGGVHMNFTPLIGIMAGPVLGGIIVLCVNIFSAAIGHGGWGLLGANLLVNLAEVSVAYFVYRWLKGAGIGIFSRAGIATLLGLGTGNITMILIILVSGIQGVGLDSVSMLYGLALLAGINMGVAAIESIVTGFAVSYIGRIRPDIIGGVESVARTGQ